MTTEIPRENEANLKRCVEEMLGGVVVQMERQLRWRPAWFIELKKPHGEIIKVHARGDRESDVMPFPELKREADILRVLEANGIPVPHVYGMCDEPRAIIMATMPGTRDVTTAKDDAERKSVARQYIDALVAMHNIPVEQFAEIGIEVPEGADNIALAGLNAYMGLYIKHKKQPDPLIEFAIHWLKSNVPQHRTTPAFIAFDAGQFLFENGKLTTLYDFEFAMVGDPLTDLATMAMRQSVEHMGDEINDLCHYYAEKTGQPLDIAVVRYHNALFATSACMQFVGSLTNPQPGDPHDVYIDWDLALRRSLLAVLGENLGLKPSNPEPVDLTKTANYALHTMISDAVNRIEVTEGMATQQKTAAQRLIEYSIRKEQAENSLQRLAREDALQLLGIELSGLEDIDAVLENFVANAGPDYDEKIYRYLSNQHERKVQVYSDIAIGQSAKHVRLEIIEKQVTTG